MTEPATAELEARIRHVDPRTEAAVMIEVAVAIAIGVLPHLHAAIASYAGWTGVTTAVPVGYNASYLLVQSVTVAAPVLYIMWRSGEPWSTFGIVPFRPKDVVGGVGVEVVAYATHLAFWWGLYFAWAAGYARLVSDDRTEGMFAAPVSSADHVLVLAMSVVNGFTEELVARGYLIPRLERVFRSTWKAVLLSTGLFAAYHVYQGVSGAVSVAVLGLVYAGAFVWLRRLWPVAIAHALADVAAFVSMGG